MGSFVNQFALAFVRHWLLVFNSAVTLLVTPPWLAPVFMRLGWELPGRAIYFVYSFLCHQLPQRSYFLFGPQATYSLAEIQAVWPVPASNWLALRQFIGTPEMGYKVAWSDRMVSMYGAFLLGGLLFALVRHRLRPLRLRWYPLWVAPIFFDGVSHTINDFTGWGFRDTNAWLAALTENIFPAAFYAGDALGAFNWWLRLLTGLIFGLGTVWLAYPYLERGFDTIHAHLGGGSPAPAASWLHLHSPTT